MESLFDLLRQWNARQSSFVKLQHAYVLVAVVSLVAAGIVGLINYNLGQSILFVATVAALVFIANGVIWAILNTFVITRLKKPVIKSPRK